MARGGSVEVAAEDAKRRRGVWAWVGVFVLAAAVRLVYLYQVEDFIYFHHLVGDAEGYDAWARRLAAGEWWWPEPFYQAPLYPYFVACWYKLLGRDLWMLRAVQIVLGSAGCVGVGLAGGRWFSRRGGLIAAVLAALYPPGIYFDGIIQKASLGFVLMAGLLCALAWGVRRTGKWVWFAAGVLLGLLALTRENALALGPVVLAWLVFFRRDSDRRRRWTVGLLFVAGWGVVLLPVGLHNLRVGGAFSLTTFQMGPNFYMGNHAGADGRYQPMIPGRETPAFERADATALAERQTGRALSPREVSDYWLGRALSDIRSDPVAWLRLSWMKWRLVWNRYEIPDTESYYIYRDRSGLLGAIGMALHFGVLCPLAVAGVWLTWSRRRELSLLYLLILVAAGSVALFYVFGRYRYPLVPMLAMFAGAGLSEGVDRIRAKRLSSLVPAVSAAILAAVWVNRPVNPEAALNAGQLGNLGAALASAGRLDEALPCFERAVAAFPEAPRLRQFLADALSLEGRYAEAIPHYQAALDREPDRANADFNLAVALEHVGRVDAALEHYRRAAAVDPTDTGAREAIRRLQAGR